MIQHGHGYLVATQLIRRVFMVRMGSVVLQTYLVHVYARLDGMITLGKSSGCLVVMVW